MKINFGLSQTELQDDKAPEIERIYVLKDFHGKKAGQILYEKAVEIAREKGAGYIWSGVWEESFRAISFYRKNDFVAFDRHIFKSGNDEQTDIMMRMNLQLNEAYKIHCFLRRIVEVQFDFFGIPGLPKVPGKV